MKKNLPAILIWFSTTILALILENLYSWLTGDYVSNLEKTISYKTLLHVCIFLFSTALALLYLVFQDQRNQEHDMKLFQKFLDTLPSNDAIQYLRDTPMEGIVDASRFRGLNKFIHEWDNAENEFMTRTIEKHKRKLMESISVFLGYFSLNTWNLRENLQQIPPEWREDQPARYKKVETELNRMADNIVKTHQQFVRLCKVKLKL